MDETVLDVLRGIEDPELGVNLVDVGLVYEAALNGARLRVRLTATSRACPLGEYMCEQARDRLANMFPYATDIDVALTFAPPWSPLRISAAGRAELAR